MPLDRKSALDVAGLSRRGLLRTAAFAALAAPAAAWAQDAAAAYDMAIRRDPGCGCCHAWAALMDRSGRFRTTMADEADMRAFKASVGVPADLASCHTAIVDGFVIEGHVPAADVLRLLEQRPYGVLGLAAPGMPLGSPGMEMADGRKEAYTVFAFQADGTRSAFAQYEA